MRTRSTDPLDGTKEFTEGVLDAVTILVGVAVSGRAAAGVINQPFAQRTIVGVRGRGSFDCRIDEATDRLVDVRPILLSRPASAASDGCSTVATRIVVTTRSHMSAALAAMVDAVRPSEVLRAGGCGGKCILLLDGRADAYVCVNYSIMGYCSCIVPLLCSHLSVACNDDMH
jgi:3'(2'), 5'-bisphosphate nucleotidase